MSQLQTVTIKQTYADVLHTLGDVQASVDLALQRYIIEQITSKIAHLREKDRAFQAKYDCDYATFVERISRDEQFIAHIEKHVSKMWETDQAEWEFCYKGIDDWTNRLQTILPEAPTPKPRMTIRQFRESGLIGMWKDRDDIQDSATYARQLREEARSGDDLQQLLNQVVYDTNVVLTLDQVFALALRLSASQQQHLIARLQVVLDNHARVHELDDERAWKNFEAIREMIAQIPPHMTVEEALRG